MYNSNNLSIDLIDEIIIRVKALIINSKKEIILGYCNKTYQFPGGHLEEGESLEQALIREIKEETGISFSCVTTPFLKVTHRTLNYHNTGRNCQNEIYYYLIKSDEEPDINNNNLDKYEIEGAYEIKKIPLKDFEKTLQASIYDNPQNQIISMEMLEAYNRVKDRL